MPSTTHDHVTDALFTLHYIAQSVETLSKDFKFEVGKALGRLRRAKEKELKAEEVNPSNSRNRVKERSLKGLLKRWREEEGGWVAVEEASNAEVARAREEQRVMEQAASKSVTQPPTPSSKGSIAGAVKTIKQMTLNVDYLIDTLRHVSAASVEAQEKASAAISLYKGDPQDMPNVTQPKALIRGLLR
jgi:hypothetical protein